MSESEKDALRQLFIQYDEKEQALELAKSEVEKCMEERSEILQEIKDGFGEGPYNWKGNVVKIVKRGSTLFFRGKGQKDVIEV
jgi:hypothetical protein